MDDLDERSRWTKRRSQWLYFSPLSDVEEEEEEYLYLPNRDGVLCHLMQLPNVLTGASHQQYPSMLVSSTVSVPDIFQYQSIERPHRLLRMIWKFTKFLSFPGLHLAAASSTLAI